MSKQNKKSSTNLFAQVEPPLGSVYSIMYVQLMG